MSLKGNQGNADSRLNLHKQTTHIESIGSSKHYNLPQIIKKYQQFCDMFYNVKENNPPLKKRQKSPQLTKQPSKRLFYVDASKETMKFLDNDNYDFRQSVFYHQILFSQLDFQSNNQSVGLEMNNQLDYNLRFKRLLALKSKEEDNYGNEDFVIQDSTQIRANENVKLFDEATHNIIQCEIRDQAATKIQICFRSQPHTKRRRDRIFFGLDSSKSFIIFIYIDKTLTSSNGDVDILSLLFVVYFLPKGTLFIQRKAINELLFDNAISAREISKALPDLIDKIIEEHNKDQSESNEDKKNDYAFIDDKFKSKDIQQSLSSIKD